MKTLKLTLVALIALATLPLLTPEAASAQAWIREPGSAYVNLGYRFIRADQFFGPDGETVSLNPYRQHALSVYGEVGIVRRWLMATIDGELVRRNVLVDRGATTGLGDIRIGLFTGLVTKPVNLSFGVLVGLPTGDPLPQSDDPSQAVTANLLPTGDGEVDITPTLALGHGFRWRKVDQFVQATLGYAIRTTPREVAIGEPVDIRDQLVYRAETGIRIDRTFIRRFLFIVRFAGQFTVQGRDEGFSRQGVAGLGDGVEFHAFGLETLVKVHGGFGVGFGMDSVFFARNVPAAAAFKLSLSYEL